MKYIIISSCKPLILTALYYYIVKLQDNIFTHSMVNKHMMYFLFGGTINNPAMHILGELTIFNISAVSVSRSRIIGSWTTCIISFIE